MGVNGYIWVSVSVGERNNAAVEGFVDAEGVYSDVNDVSCVGLYHVQTEINRFSPLCME
jgi:hypothetical protein